MKFRQLKALQAVYNTGSVTQAAKMLNVSQPAVSSMLAVLEHEMGFLLFERVKGRLYPTPEAGFIFEEIKKTLSNVEQISRTANNIREMKTGILRIASMPGASLVFMPQLVASFLKDKPDVKATLHSRWSPRIHEWIASKLFDVGLAEMPVDLPGINVTPVYFDCMVALEPNHPLAAKSHLSPEDLKGVPLITLNSDHMTAYRAREVFSRHNVTMNVRYEVEMFAPACALVAQNAGAAFVDPITVENFKNFGIVTRPFLPEIRFDIAILTPKERPRSLLADGMVELLKQSLLDLGATISD